jgi:hypothetical protein
VNVVARGVNVTKQKGVTALAYGCILIVFVAKKKTSWIFFAMQA